MLVGVAASSFAGPTPTAHAKSSTPTWHASIRRIHARFRGRPGTFAQFGDSITLAAAFWTPLRGERRNASPALEQAFRRANTTMRPVCWGEWKGPTFGSMDGQTTRWARGNVNTWLRKLKPEVAVILFGTNDLHQMEFREYRTNLRYTIQRCLKNGTIPILTTPPPQHGFEADTEQFAQGVRQLARELKLPLVDYHAEILTRRPNDWDGTLPQFREYDPQEVPTLIGGDGSHPSFPNGFQNDYSEEGLRTSGYTLRNALTLLKYAEVLTVLHRSSIAEG